MFNWATEKLEQLSQAVAPPSDDPASKFVYCVQKGDEAGAQESLAGMDPLYTIVQSTKGTTPLHLACLHSMVNLIRQIMSIPGASMEVTDAAGNTPLHHASMSTDQANGLYVVKMLITEYNASVVAKNWAGQTPYDVATLNGIRQYLLPIQLQQETQQAIDNGGVGLPPGIDMGGMRISQPAMAPPPIGGMSSAGGPLPATPPGGPPPMLATPSPNVPGAAAAAMSTVAPSVVQPNAPHSANAASTAAAPASAGQQPPPQAASAPSSGNHTYSRTGSSSAAVLSKAKFRPDGFHSSSSDVSLQKKYGHSSHSLSTAAAVPPPPSSGNSSASGSGGVNPYAAGSSAFGSANRYGAAVPTSRAYPSAYGVAPSSGGAAPSYAVFQPGAPAQTPQVQQPAYPQQQQPYSSELQQQQPTTPFMSPPPYQQQQQPAQQAPAHHQPVVTQQQPQMNTHHQPSQAPYQQAQAVYQQQPIATQQQQMNAYPQPVSQPQSATSQPAMPSPYPMTHAVSTGNTSTASAEEVFGSPSKQEDPVVPVAEPATTRAVTEDSTRSSVSSAQELFSTSVAAETSTNTSTQETKESNNNQNEGNSNGEASHTATGEPNPTEASPLSHNGAKTAADFFGANGAAAEPAPVDSPLNNPAVETAREESAAESADGGMDDVPLEEVPLTPSDGSATTNTPGQAAAAFSAGGLPPPPFSSRQ